MSRLSARRGIQYPAAPNRRSPAEPAPTVKGSFSARHPGLCPSCRKTIKRGQKIRSLGSVYVHVNCRDRSGRG